MTHRELLVLYGRILDALRARGVIRSANNPVADYAEGLCRRALKLTLTNKSTAGYDGIGPSDRKIEINARRITKGNGSRQLSAIGGLEHGHFDFLAGILFTADFAVWKGCLIPYAVIKQYSTHTGRTNSHPFLLRDVVWSIPGVQGITEVLKEAESVGV